MEHVTLITCANTHHLHPPLYITYARAGRLYTWHHDPLWHLPVCSFIFCCTGAGWTLIHHHTRTNNNNNNTRTHTGEEDGVDNSHVKAEELYTKPEEVYQVRDPSDLAAVCAWVQAHVRPQHATRAHTHSPPLLLDSCRCTRP